MAAVRGLAEIVLIVGDVDRSLQFYRDVLGLTVISPAAMKGPVFLQAGQPAPGAVPQQIVLVPRPPDAPAPSSRMARGVHHIGLEIGREDFEREQERLRELGYELRRGEHPFLPVQAFYLDDP
ncbi:MAG: hypothetical protein QOF51_2761, partial [Chloroflexota bacterium]|nr:hypothetical protein [Chloroflexota bacterium]